LSGGVSLYGVGGKVVGLVGFVLVFLEDFIVLLSWIFIMDDVDGLFSLDIFGDMVLE